MSSLQSVVHFVSLLYKHLTDWRRTNTRLLPTYTIPGTPDRLSSILLWNKRGFVWCQSDWWNIGDLYLYRGIINQPSPALTFQIWDAVSETCGGDAHTDWGARGGPEGLQQRHQEAKDRDTDAQHGRWVVVVVLVVVKYSLTLIWSQVRGTVGRSNSSWLISLLTGQLNHQHSLFTSHLIFHLTGTSSSFLFKTSWGPG